MKKKLYLLYEMPSKRMNFWGNEIQLLRILILFLNAWYFFSVGQFFAIFNNIFQRYGRNLNKKNIFCPYIFFNSVHALNKWSKGRKRKKNTGWNIFLPFLILHDRIDIWLHYSVMQSDGYSFCRDVVLDSCNKTSWDENRIFDQIYKIKYVRIIIMMILILHNILRKCIPKIQ